MSDQTKAAIVPSGDNEPEQPLCAGCRCIAAALAEVGMNPNRVMCHPAGDPLCSIGCGYGTEGLPLDQVERLVDKAIAVCAGARSTNV